MDSLRQITCQTGISNQKSCQALPGKLHGPLSQQIVLALPNVCQWIARSLHSVMRPDNYQTHLQQVSTANTAKGD